jgi:cardiolipin synthase
MKIFNKKFSFNNTVKLIKNDGSFIEATVDLIQSAKHTIYLQTYIFEVDEVTESVLNALNKKAQEGILISIVLDSLGSIDFPWYKLHPDIRFRFFSPLLSKGLFGVWRRLHSKVLIIDFNKAVVGGINYSKRFNGYNTSKPWLDYACLITGEEVFNISKALKLKPLNKFKTKETCKVKTNINDWGRFKNQIYRSYIKAINTSKKEIIIIAPYFLPGKKLLKSLKKATQRGVEISLIFSANSDQPLERWYSKFLYSWLLKNKVSIYEWEESILHGKLAIIDSEWVTIGSYNHNATSQFGNHEMNLEIQDSEFGRVVDNEVKFIRANSNQITNILWSKRNKLVHKFYEVSIYIFANILTLVSVLLVSRKKDKGDNNLLE